MPSRQLDFPVFDADNHMYETPDALTKFLPDELRRASSSTSRCEGRTKIAVKGQHQRLHPQPHLRAGRRAGRPGGVLQGRQPRRQDPPRDHGQGHRRAPRPSASRRPRLELMDELGLDRALMWPTLASLVEERLRDDPDAIHVVIHALNEWMHETWTFNYEDRIFPTPVITLPIVEKAIEELEWVTERGAKIILVRPAPVPGLPGPAVVRAAGVRPVLGARAGEGRRRRHARLRQRLPALHQRVGGRARRRVHAVRRRRRASPPSPTPATAPIIDTVASAIGHGMCTRFPRLKITPVENGSGWVRPLLHDMESAYAFNPHLFEEDPVEVFKRNIFVHPFHEDDPVGLCERASAPTTCCSAPTTRTPRA